MLDMLYLELVRKGFMFPDRVYGDIIYTGVGVGVGNVFLLVLVVMFLLLVLLLVCCCFGLILC